jgi:four helix bundle protein
MAKIKKFEEIESWRKARRLTKQVYEATAVGNFKHDFGLRDQIRRASVPYSQILRKVLSVVVTRNSFSSWR